MNKFTKILTTILISSLLVVGGVQAVTKIFPFQGGTGQDTSGWNGLIEVNDGTWATTTDNTSNWNTAYSERGSQIGGLHLTWDGNELDADDNLSSYTNDSGFITGNETITISGDASGSGTTSIPLSLASDSVSDNEVDYTNVTLGDFTNDAGYLTGNETITLSGDVSGSGATSISTTLNTLSDLIVQGTSTLYDVTPAAATTYDLGASGSRWNKVWTQDLDVSGAFTLGGTVDSGGIDLDGNSLIIDSDGNTQLIGDNDDTIDFDIGGQTSEVQFSTTTASFAGQVGIGTTKPGAKLDVDGDIQFGDSHSIGDDAFDNLMIESSSIESIVLNSSNNIYFRNNGTELMYLKGTNGHFGIGTTDPGEILSVDGNVMVGDNTWAGKTTTGDMAIQGNVGIGTTDPGSKLSVSGSKDSTVSTTTAVSEVGAGNMHLYTNAMNTSPYSIWMQVLRDTGSTYPLALNPKGGNVGIGTTNPDSSLQIDEQLNGTDKYGQIDYTSTKPASTDCDSDTEAGRMIGYSTSSPILFICAGSGGWATTTLNF